MLKPDCAGLTRLQMSCDLMDSRLSLTVCSRVSIICLLLCCLWSFAF